MRTHTLSVEGRTIEVPRWQKVLFPDDGITKGDLVMYYLRIAPTMLPHVRGRPVSMQRFPDGIAAAGFFQKEVPDAFPDWMPRHPVYVHEEGRPQPQLLLNDAATLAYLAAQATITPHVWLSRVPHLTHPDRLIFDLDPPDGATFDVVRRAAFDLRDLLAHIGAPTFVMTTGSRGVHVVIPLQSDATFDETRSLAHAIAEQLAQRFPERYTTALRREKRQGRLFLDYLRNAYGQTAVAPYAVRARTGAPVATPLDWYELRRPNMHAQRYTLRTIFRRLAHKPDPWREIERHAVSVRMLRAALQRQ
nr:non-homologous end-joining DNA ligase [Ardenticatena sp.]